FDSDAHGIVHVSAKDKATGREQKIRIEASSGLQDADVERLVREAEEHREEDKKKQQRAELRNRAEAMVHSAEKTLSEHGDKLPETEKAELQTKIDALSKAVSDYEYEAMESGLAEIEKLLHAAVEKMYQAAGGQAPDASH